MNGPALGLETRQQQTLTPRLQQAVRLLQMSSLDFALELHETAEKNPFLEIEDSEETPPYDNSHTHSGGAEVRDQITQNTAQTVAVESQPENDIPQDAESWISDANASTPRNGANGNNPGTMDFTETQISLRQHLRGQLGLMRLTPREHHLACVVAEAVDDDGYLRMTLEELQLATELSPGAEQIEILAALGRVQSLEPSGVGARDVGECLLLQLDNSAEGGAEKDLARRVVRDHLNLLARHDNKGLAAALGTDSGTIERLCARIRRLSPRPGLSYGGGSVQYIAPDVLVRKRGDKWEAVLNWSVIPKVRLNHLYAELFQHHRESHHGDLATHLQEARWAVRNVEQRFVTILRVSQAIVARQTAFLEFGPLAMRPMGLREIAEALELHESTVSRVTNNKYIATPAGVFELKHFFSRALDTTHGKPRSVVSVRASIKQMIEEESSKAPLSDAEIARLLLRRGLKVARRTVTKYRQLMRIPAVGMRRAV